MKLPRPKNGYIGHIRSIFWRRVVLILLTPVIFACLIPIFARPLPRLLASIWDDACEAFEDCYGDGWRTAVAALSSLWASSWNPPS